jgi:hypothetical protein
MAETSRHSSHWLVNTVEQCDTVTSRLLFVSMLMGGAQSSFHLFASVIRTCQFNAITPLIIEIQRDQMDLRFRIGSKLPPQADIKWTTLYELHYTHRNDRYMDAKSKTNNTLSMIVFVNRVSSTFGIILTYPDSIPYRITIPPALSLSSTPVPAPTPVLAHNSSLLGANIVWVSSCPIHMI